MGGPGAGAAGVNQPGPLPVSSHHQSGALSLVGRVEIALSLVETFIELNYFHDVAMPAKERRGANP